MVRTLCLTGGIALFILWIVSLSTPESSRLIGWMDLAAAIFAMGLAGLGPSKRWVRATAAGCIGIGIVLTGVWIISFSQAAPWQAWWNFALAVLMLVAGITAAAEAPPQHAGVGAGALYMHRRFDRSYGAGGGVPYGVGSGWPFYGLGGYYDDDWALHHYERENAEAGQYAGVGPSGYQRSDERIAEDINDALMGHGFIDASRVTVRVAESVVTLEGIVPERRQRRLAETIAERTLGVKDVRNRLATEAEAREAGARAEAPYRAA